MRVHAIFCLFFTVFIKGAQTQNLTDFSDPQTIVVQVYPKQGDGNATIGNYTVPKIRAFVFIPKNEPMNSYIGCRFNYFQKNASFKGKWILDNQGFKFPLDRTDSIRRVLITRKTPGKEEVIDLPAQIGSALLTYFKRDVYHNTVGNKGFDCYAFASLVSNVQYNAASPAFSYKKQVPKKGQFIVLTTSASLVSVAVKHWALYLGDDIYLSKFGRTGYGSPALLTFMNLQNMMQLYNCKFYFVAEPKPSAKKWNGYNWQALNKDR